MLVLYDQSVSCDLYLRIIFKAHKLLIDLKDDSNQPEFKSFIQESAVSQIEFRKVVKFFTSDHERQFIEQEFGGIIKYQADLLLRLILLPNCGDEIGDVIACLRDCLNESSSQPTCGGMIIVVICSKCLKTFSLHWLL